MSPHRRLITAAIAATQVEQLERRFMLTAVSETEPNNTAAAANVVSVSAVPTVVAGSIAGGDVDYFKFTLTQRSGVFFDIDSRETGLSTSLDTILTLFDGTGAAQIDTNDDGRDFDTFNLNDSTATPLQFGDSSLYSDLAAGTYVVRVSAYAGDSGNYELKLTADSSYTSSVPVLSSRPGAADTLYLDFDGHAATDLWGTYSIPAYDLNGNASEWTPAEQLAMRNIWELVADDFAPFDINVTTSYGGSYTPDATAFRMVIGNSNGSQVGATGTLGASFNNSYANLGPGAKTGFTFASNFQDVSDAGMSGKVMAAAIEIGNTTAQEFAQALGLVHYGGTNSHPNAIMQTPDFGLNRERWTSGNTSSNEPPVVFQDDVAVIASAANTFGYRSDDHGNSRPAATILTAAGNSYYASGVIEQTSDADYFRFTASGNTTITLDIPEHLYHLNGQLSLFDASGNLIVTADTPNKLGTSITASLTAGTYYVQVASHGSAGEIGQYALQINTVPILTPTGSIAGRVFRDVTLNGVYEPGSGDAAMGGVTVFIDADHDGVFDAGESSTTTALDGSYAFASLTDGGYDVKQIVPGGYVSSSTQNLVIAAGEPHAGTDFSDFPIVFTGSGGDDTYTVQLQSGDASHVQILESLNGGAVLSYSAPKTLLPSLVFNAGNGSDTLTINDAVPFAVTFNGGTNAGDIDHLNLIAGNYTFNTDAAVGTANLALTIDGASVLFNDTQHLKSLSIAAGVASMSVNGSHILCTDTLSIAAGKLNLNDNDLIVRAGPAGSWDGSAYTGVMGLVQSGFNGGTWDGNGMVTGMSDAISPNVLTALVAASASDLLGLAGSQSDLWEGETVTGESIMVKYTWGGDANLDGTLNGDDYFQIDSHFNQDGVAFGYFNGDFNYDGAINGDDYFVIDSNWNAGSTADPL